MQDIGLLTDLATPASCSFSPGSRFMQAAATTGGGYLMGEWLPHHRDRNAE